MPHKGHETCIFDTKKGCEAAKRLEMGKCAALKDDGEECTHWGIERVGGRAYCGQHLNSVYLKSDNDRRAAARKAELDTRISTYLAWRAAHPSLHDTMREA